MITYRFTITSTLNGSILATGVTTASRNLNDVEQLELVHNWNHGIYRSKHVSININKEIQ